MNTNNHFTTNMNEDNKTDRQEYRESIEMGADVIEEEIEPEDHQDVHEMIHATVDNSKYVIYTSMHLKALEHCENDPKEFNYMISNDDSYSEILQTLAYCAVRNDVMAELRDRDLL